jgi:hypothetical protein
MHAPDFLFCPCPVEDNAAHCLVRPNRYERRDASNVKTRYLAHSRHADCVHQSGNTPDRAAHRDRTAAGVVGYLSAWVDSWTWNGISQPLHLQNLYQEADIYREGAPTAIVHADRDVRLTPGDLPCAESLQAFAVPAFRRYDIYAIEAFANAFDKVCRHHHELL